MPTTHPAPPDAHLADWIIFLLVYVGVAIGTFPFTRLSRPAIALLGAIAVVALDRVSFTEATAGHIIDWTTLALLFALMLLSASLRVSGFYTRVAGLILDHAHRPWTLLVGIVAASAVLSAIFANDIICLAFTPVLTVALRRAGKNPVPYLLALATSSNIGSAATIIGNPQNMLIGQSAKLSFGHFALVVSPLVLVCLVLNVLVVAFVYRRELFTEKSEVRSETSEIGAGGAGMASERVRPWHITKALLITAGLVGCFLFAPVPREITALVAAGLVLVSRTQDPRKLFALVDWDLILLFIGLFVVIGNVQRQGLLTGIMADIQSHVPLYAPIPFSAVTLVLSNLVSNVPAVLLLKPGLAVPAGPSDPVTATWYLLAVVSTFAGNLTLLGSIANLIVAEQARPHGITLSFREYLKVGLPLTILTTVLGVLYFAVLR
jgi:Na+/H+ antiporter NhaD/arsenite permease-like protein